VGRRGMSTNRRLSNSQRPEVLKDLARPRLQQLVQLRVPDASPSLVESLTLALVTETRQFGGPESKMWLRCTFQKDDQAPEAGKLLDACVQEAKGAFMRAGGTVNQETADGG
jgi:hypothetical protein